MGQGKDSQSCQPSLSLIFLWQHLETERTHQVPWCCQQSPESPPLTISQVLKWQLTDAECAPFWEFALPKRTFLLWNSWSWITGVFKRLDTYFREMCQCCIEAEFGFEDFRSCKWILTTPKKGYLRTVCSLLMGRNIIASFVLTLWKNNNQTFPTVVETHNAFLAQIRYLCPLKPLEFTAKNLD